MDERWRNSAKPRFALFAQCLASCSCEFQKRKPGPEKFIMCMQWRTKGDKLYLAVLVAGIIKKFRVLQIVRKYGSEEKKEFVNLEG